MGTGAKGAQAALPCLCALSPDVTAERLLPLLLLTLACFDLFAVSIFETHETSQGKKANGSGLARQQVSLKPEIPAFCAPCSPFPSF